MDVRDLRVREGARMNRLFVDIETKSGADISKTGAYKYVMDEAYEILLIAYKYNDHPVVIWDIPQLKADNALSALNQFRTWLQDPSVIKHSYNAAFEWFCFNQAGYTTPLDQWQDTMAHALYCGYAAGLEATGNAIGLPQYKKKLASGKALIRYFCTPAKPTKANGGRTWNEPKHDPDKWADFKTYCMQDVEAEYAIQQRLDRFPMPKEEIEQWRDNVWMNAFGVRCDKELVEGALLCDSIVNARLTEEAIGITKLSNPNSNQQLLGWLSAMGYPLPDMTKATVAKALEGDLPGNIRRVLEIRQQTGKTSVKKYKATLDMLGKDDRVRGLTQYYGANRTGRFSGRGVQLQNLPRNYIGALDEARKLVKAGNTDALSAIYGNVPDTLSQLIRTAFIPSEGNKLVVADFSAIEARVIAWLAGETWVNEVFATHGKIYEATAAQMFHVPIESIAKGQENYDLRQKGKVATLALGYQGGPAALTAMGALNMGISESELPDIVSKWRNANPNIVKLWQDVEDAAVDTVRTGQQHTVRGGLLTFALEGDVLYGQTFLTIRLPSGRKLFYVNPTIEENRFGKPAVHYFGSSATTKKWERTSTYGGRCVENLCQSIARDCLAVSLTRIRAHGWDVVFHVHDEVVIDAPMDLSVDVVCDLMSEPIDWAPGLVLKAAGFESNYYKKD